MSKLMIVMINLIFSGACDSVPRVENKHAGMYPESNNSEPKLKNEASNESNLKLSIASGIWAQDAFGMNQVERVCKGYNLRPPPINPQWLCYARDHSTGLCWVARHIGDDWNDLIDNDCKFFERAKANLRPIQEGGYFLYVCKLDLNYHQDCIRENGGSWAKLEDDPGAKTINDCLLDNEKRLRSYDEKKYAFGCGDSSSSAKDFYKNMKNKESNSPGNLDKK
jgi:hypothetical protein